MTITYKVNGVAMTNRVRLLDEGSGFVTAAERGAVGSGGVLIDDPASALTINGWQTFTIDDDEAFPEPRVFTGYIADRGIGRQGRMRSGTDRVHDCTVIDQNALLHTKVLHANAAKRGAESDVARIAYLLTSEALSGIVYDEGLNSASNAINFLESDLRRGFADDAISAMCTVAGKNFFVYRDTGTGLPALFYDKDDAAVYSSTLRISNVSTDVDGSVTYAPSRDAVLTRTPENQYGGVSYGWKGAPLFVTSAATIASMGLERDGVFDTDRVGLLATAQSESVRWLNQHAAEVDTIAVTIIVPSAHVNDVYAGQRIQVKFQHLPGYTSFTWTRVRRRSVKPAAPQFWEMRLELYVPPVAATDAAASAPAAILQSTSAYFSTGGLLTLTNPVTPGNILIYQQSVRNNSAVSPKAGSAVGPTRAFTNLIAPVSLAPGDTLTFGYRSATGDEQSLWFGVNDVVVIVYEVSVISVADCIAATGATAGGVGVTKTIGTLASGAGHVALMGIITNQDGDATNSEVPGAGWTEAAERGTGSGSDGHPHTELAYAVAPAGSLPAVVVGANKGWAGIAIDIGGSSATATPLPTPGDPIQNETAGGTVNASNTAFTTAYGFITLPTSTLRVFDDGLDQTDHVSASDGAAGTFSLDYAPSYGSVIRTFYTAR